jgi:hypothetical protein
MWPSYQRGILPPSIFLPDGRVLRLPFAYDFYFLTFLVAPFFPFGSDFGFGVSAFSAFEALAGAFLLCRLLSFLLLSSLLSP